MAPKRKASRSQAGSTMYGVLAGLLIGLTIAAAVAFYVTRAPMPFVDRASRQHEPANMPDLSKINPNQGLAGGTVTVPPAPTPGGEDDADKGKTDDLGALIASLPHDDKKLAAAEAPAASDAAPASAPASKPASAASKAAPVPAAVSGAVYFLQAGAYRQSADAESMRARILLLGLKAAVQRAQVKGAQWYRVRVGPFARLDDMNRARVVLADKKISSTVVRQ